MKSKLVHEFLILCHFSIQSKEQGWNYWWMSELFLVSLVTMFLIFMV